MGPERAAAPREADMVSSVLLMGAGVWMLMTAVAPGHLALITAPHAPRMFSLLVGVWFVVKGALRLDSY